MVLNHKQLLEEKLALRCCIRGGSGYVSLDAAGTMRTMLKALNKRANIAWLLVSLAALLLLSACGEAPAPKVERKAQATPLPSLSGLPVQALQGQITGLLPLNQTLQLTIGLPTDRQGLAQLAQEVYNPASPQFAHYLKPEQIASRYGASDATIQKVKNWLSSQGFQILDVSALHTHLVVQASALQIAKAFQLILQMRTLDGRTFFGPNQAPTLPPAIAPLVTSISGLSDFTLLRHIPMQLGDGSASASPAAAQLPQAGDCSLYGVGPFGNIKRDQIAHTYGYDQVYKKGFSGQGMTIGVLELGEPYSRNDVANYAACNGDQLHLRNVEVDGPLVSGAGVGEAALDLEMIAGLAPEATILDYQTPRADDTGFLDGLNKVAADDTIQVLSVSYGAGEDQFGASYLAQLNDTLEILAIEGISVLIASGDCAAFSDGVFGQLQVSFPASAPWAIAVGGTSFQGNLEIAWSASNPNKLQCGNGWGTGGGVSKVASFTLPVWQSGPGVKNQYSTGNRQLPDVAALADNIAIYHENLWQPVAGTSASAPIWAAGVLLLDQALQKVGKPLFGGVPTIYQLANARTKYHPFHDITLGNNLYYQAGSGWDYPTGFGSPNLIDMAHMLGAF